MLQFYSGEGSLQDCIKSYTRYFRVYIRGLKSTECVLLFTVVKVRIKAAEARIARQEQWREPSQSTPTQRKSCTSLKPSIVYRPQ